MFGSISILSISVISLHSNAVIQREVRCGILGLYIDNLGKDSKLISIEWAKQNEVWNEISVITWTLSCNLQITIRELVGSTASTTWGFSAKLPQNPLKPKGGFSQNQLVSSGLCLHTY